MLKRPFRLLAIGVVLASATAAVAVAATGASPGASSFVPIAPCRLVDTRPAGPQVGSRGAPLNALEQVTFPVTGTNGNCSIPATATAIAANITTLNGTTASHLRVYPGNAGVPNSSVNNWVAGQGPTPNSITVALSPEGSIRVRNQTGTVDVIIDVSGYYEPVSAPVATAAPVATTTTTSTTLPAVVQGGTNQLFVAPYRITSDAAATTNSWLLQAGGGSGVAGRLFYEFDAVIMYDWQNQLGETLPVLVSCSISFGPHFSLVSSSQVTVRPAEFAPIHLSGIGLVMPAGASVQPKVTCVTDRSFIDLVSVHTHWIVAPA